MQLPRSKVLAIVCGGTFVGLSSVAAANMMTVDDEMLAMNGQFEVGNGETHLIASHKKDEQYRICVDKSRLSVPLKVIQNRTVGPTLGQDSVARSTRAGVIGS